MQDERQGEGERAARATKPPPYVTEEMAEAFHAEMLRWAVVPPPEGRKLWSVTLAHEGDKFPTVIHRFATEIEAREFHMMAAVRAAIAKAIKQGGWYVEQPVDHIFVMPAMTEEQTLEALASALDDSLSDIAK